MTCNEKHIKRLIIFIVTPFVALVLMGNRGGCGDAREALKFSHARHAKEDIKDCDTCHTSDTSPVAATKEICQNCHEIDMDNPDKQCLKCHAVKDYERATRGIEAVRGGYEDSSFVHENHSEIPNVDCNTCHKGILKTSHARTNKIPEMTDCQACHRKNKAEAKDCAFCHKTIRDDVEPESHTTAWESMHGDASASVNARCDLCHQVSSCESCHLDTPPRNHTEQYRNRGHGQLARYDRGKCKTCHTEDACISCHQDTPPRSHRPGWAEPDNRHCNSCHLPLESVSCGVCHLSIPPGVFHNP